MPRPPSRTLAVLASSVFALSGCGGFGSQQLEGVFLEIPDTPTYSEHIQPLMAAYCDDCHFETFLGSDRYLSTRYETLDDVQGVFEARKRLLDRVIAEIPSPMPPLGEARVGAIDKEILSRWVDIGAPP